LRTRRLLQRVVATLTLPLLTAALVVHAVPAAGQRAQPATTFEEMPAAARAAIERGLTRLTAMQGDDGSFGGGRYGRHVGITAIAGLALLADGNLPGRGARGEAVQRALQFVLANTNEAGLLAADTSHGPMYGHGYATLFLGEVYGSAAAGVDTAKVRATLIRAVRLIVDCQNDEGGWRYHPQPYDADLSVTITQIMALRSARNAGISVPKETIDRAVSYVRRCQNPEDGGFRYMLRGGGSAYARSAAGVASLQYAGVYDDDAVRDGLKYLSKVVSKLASKVASKVGAGFQPARASPPPHHALLRLLITACPCPARARPGPAAHHRSASRRGHHRCAPCGLVGPNDADL